jgi:uncharacterized protein (TIGR00251 family)
VAEDPTSEAVVLHQSGSDVRLRLRVKPGARDDRLLGAHDGSLKLEVRAAPERGRANAAVVRLLATSLSRPTVDIEITAGSTGRSKTAVIRGCPAEEIAECLRSLGIAARAE